MTRLAMRRHGQRIAAITSALGRAGRTTGTERIRHLQGAQRAARGLDEAIEADIATTEAALTDDELEAALAADDE